jgi:DNA repair exonuclease SbcCD ATPase subunit
MRTVELEALEISGFRSFRAATTIRFSRTPGLKFLTGDNQQEPRLEANGAGKSSLWDALFWCLYGVSVRGMRASELSSWKQKTRPQVTATLLIDGEAFQIQRLGNPDKLAIEGEPVEQKELDGLLGLSRERFRHSVLFGQNMPLFPDLPLNERAALMDEVLDLSIWLKASDHAARQAITLQIAIDREKLALARAEGELAGLGSADALEKNAAAWEANQAALFEQAVQRFEAAAMQAEELQAKIAKAEKLLEDLPAQEFARNKQLAAELQQEIADIKADYQALVREQEAMQGGGVCPTCKRPLDRSHASHKGSMAELRSRMQQNGGKDNLARKRLAEVQAEIERHQRILTFRQTGLIEARAAEAAHSRIVESLLEQAERIGAETENPYRKRIAEMQAQRQAAEAACVRHIAERQRLEGQAQLADYWKQAFKRIRLFQMRRILAHLEIEVSNAAQALGLIGWRIEFLTETETKSGTIKQGVQIRITSPIASAIWEAWSGGEGQRIRLAIAQGFAGLVQRMAGVDYKLEVWDEPSAWLSAQGIEDLLDSLSCRATKLQRAVWIVDHRVLGHAGFSEVWQATKTVDGTRIHRI